MGVESARIRAGRELVPATTASRACDFSFTHAVGLRFHALLIAGAQEVRFEPVPKS